MRKTLVGVLAIAGVGLAGCVAVPVYDAPVAYGPPPAVVVGPTVGFSYYSGPRYRYYGGPRYYHSWRR